MEDSRLTELCFQSSNDASYFISKTNVWTRLQQQHGLRRIIPSKFLFSSIIHGALRLKYEKVVYRARTRNQQTEQNVPLWPWCLEFLLWSAAPLFTLGCFSFFSVSMETTLQGPVWHLLSNLYFSSSGERAIPLLGFPRCSHCIRCSARPITWQRWPRGDGDLLKFKASIRFRWNLLEKI